jgi:hypothetical protein
MEINTKYNIGDTIEFNSVRNGKPTKRYGKIVKIELSVIVIDSMYNSDLSKLSYNIKYRVCYGVPKKTKYLSHLSTWLRQDEIIGLSEIDYDLNLVNRTFYENRNDYKTILSDLEYYTAG